MRRLPLALLFTALPVAAALLSATACSRRMIVHPSRPAPLVAPGPNTLLPGTFLDTPGHCWFYESDRSTDLTLTATSSSLTWEVQVQETQAGGMRSSGVSSGALNLPAVTAPWFVYVESPQKLWFFNGTEELYYEIHERSGSSSGPVISGRQLQSEHPPLPAELIARLPEDLRKLFPAATAPVEKPSF